MFSSPPHATPQGGPFAALRRALMFTFSLTACSPGGEETYTSTTEAGFAMTDSSSSSGGGPYSANVPDLPDADDDEASLADTDDIDGEGVEGLEELPFEFKPHECVHGLGEKRPRNTKKERERTKRIIRHVAKRMKMSRDFLKLLMLVAGRESSFQAGLIHRLNPDLKGSEGAWKKMNGRYKEKGNIHFDQPEKWQTYGLFGMNSNYFTLAWDYEADPRTLCDPIVNVILYSRAARRNLRKLNGTIKCRDEDGEIFYYNSEPTWANIHRAVSGGKLCPPRHERLFLSLRKKFEKRASRIGLDPYVEVSKGDLGTEPDQGLDGEPWPSQEEMVMGLWAEIEAAEAELAAKRTGESDANPTNKADAE